MILLGHRGALASQQQQSGGSDNPVSNVTIPDLSFGVEAVGSYDYSSIYPEILAPPTAEDIVLAGTFENGETITATLQGVDGDTQLGTCVWRVIRSNTIQQSSEAEVIEINDVPGDEITFNLGASEELKYIRVECDLIGEIGEVGETIFSEFYGPVAASIPPFGDVVWQEIQNVTASGNTVTHTGGTAIAKSIQEIGASSNGEVTFEWNANSRSNGNIIIGLINSGDANVMANVDLWPAILSTNLNVDVNQGSVYKNTIGYLQVDPPTHVARIYRITIDRSTNKPAFSSCFAGSTDVFANSATVSAVNGATSLTCSANHGVTAGRWISLNGVLYKTVTGTSGSTLVLEKPYAGATETITNANTKRLSAFTTHFTHDGTVTGALKLVFISTVASSQCVNATIRET